MANLLAADADSADLMVRSVPVSLRVSEGSGLDFWQGGIPAIVKNPKTGETAEVKATGIHRQRCGEKKNVQKNVQDDLKNLLRTYAEFLRGQQLKEAVALLWKGGMRRRSLRPTHRVNRKSQKRIGSSSTGKILGKSATIKNGEVQNAN
jgi:hypothetical protein